MNLPGFDEICWDNSQYMNEWPEATRLSAKLDTEDDIEPGSVWCRDCLDWYGPDSAHAIKMCSYDE